MSEHPMTAGGRYAQLESERQPYIERARAAAEITIPALMPPEAHGAHSDLPTPYQGFGARGVNNLASKLLLALLPPNAPFFRYRIAESVLEELKVDPSARAEIEEKLAEMERRLQHKIEASSLRTVIFEAFKQLIVGGNALIYIPEDIKRVRVFRLDRFVARRAPDGSLLELITKETIPAEDAPEGIQEQLKSESGSRDKTCDLYTRVYRDGDKWSIYQEIKGTIITESQGTYPIDHLPWIPLRYTSIDGESYGRGFVEEYMGDLKTLEGLTQAMVEGSAIAAKTIFLVAPNGTTDIEQIVEAENGAVIDGNASDVSTLQANKFADLQVAQQTSNVIIERLSYAFMLNSAIQRNGERVTAEEIRYMSQEIEDTLGGLYSLLAQEFQMPLVQVLTKQMTASGELPKLPDGTVDPLIVTGVEALGRGQDLMKLQAFLQDVIGLAQVVPEVVSALHPDNLLTRIATARGIDTKGLVKTQTERQAEQEQAMAEQEQQQMNQVGAEMATRAAPEVVRQVSQGMNNG